MGNSQNRRFLGGNLVNFGRSRQGTACAMAAANAHHPSTISAPFGLSLSKPVASLTTPFDRLRTNGGVVRRILEGEYHRLAAVFGHGALIGWCRFHLVNPAQAIWAACVDKSLLLG